MKLALLTAAFGFLITASANAADGDKIKVAVEGVYPPFSFVEGGTLKGFDVDIGKALCEKAKLSCEFIAQEWDGIIPGLLAKKYDAIVSSMNITEERKKKVLFGDKYYDTPTMFVAAKSAKITDTSPKGLSGKIVGVQGSTTAQNYMEEKYKGLDFKTYSTIDDALNDLAAGRIDLMISDKIQINQWLEQSKEAAECCEFVGKEIRDPILGAGKGVAFRKEDEALKDKFNVALKAILADGTYQKINAKYFPFSIY
ncbi:transporter substrate-binding domain-containing protein [Rhizobium multihospitium]|uniref:Polar amino acid transport system substrate-binding protein n=1 Tax=Rhizobium multihospitium TaxID=410764 RepID=A0A1C3X5X4_9HYPH|nr:transporter substrate-binding domain-containing protein [Rhizobium multihospitium]SCB47414.1 polar amino acid transport system substrate-binding protein [Rhizobium multihospitium]